MIISALETLIESRKKEGERGEQQNSHTLARYPTICFQNKKKRDVLDDWSCCKTLSMRYFDSPFTAGK